MFDLKNDSITVAGLISILRQQPEDALVYIATSNHGNAYPIVNGRLLQFSDHSLWVVFEAFESEEGECPPYSKVIDKPGSQ